MKIDDIWKELEEDPSSSTGLLLRRYSATILPDVYVALRQPEKLRCIAVRLPSAERITLSEYGHLGDIRLEIMSDERDGSARYLLILLSSQQHRDIFATLCEDLIWRISNLTEKEKVVKVLMNRLEKWKSLFEKAASQELSPEEQRGLFGELYFLRKWIGQSFDSLRCVSSWLGPEMDLRDFQQGDWGVEVKTTFGNNHQKIHISSERQLDPSHLKNLFLCHVSLELQNQHGENLNQLTDIILGMLTDNPGAQAQFRSRLLQAGYYSHHKPFYDKTGYHIRQTTFYSIKDGFPRLEEKDLRPGVGEVKYSIILSGFTDYAVTETSVFEIMNQHV